MVDILSQEEAAGAVPEGVNAVAWRRIEAWVSRRWSPRQVLWTARGPGMFRAPLGPVDEISAERWADGWAPASLEPDPEGWRLDGGTWRLTATVGFGDAPPAEVLEASDRLAAYLAEGAGVGVPGASSYGVNLGQLGENFRRSPQWQARAMEWSGAADLLRPYRRA